MEKKPVYNGYEERYLTGKEMIELFSSSYECSRKYPEQVSSHRMNFKKYYPEG